MKRILGGISSTTAPGVLRKAEKEFVITVAGRPVAVLGPYRKSRWVPKDAVDELLATPTEPTLRDDLAGRPSDEIRDPWNSDSGRGGPVRSPR